MKNDISRNTFDPRKHFSRVLMQQGRVQLDADWNEQATIFLHYLRTLATDLIGPHAGPEKHCGFEIIDAAAAKAAKKGTPWEELSDPEIEKAVKAAGFFIAPGRYYVDGLLCENEHYVPYALQADWPLPDGEKPEKLNGNFAAYLDVWERHITAVEAEGIREVALGGPDTATRAKVVWQVKLLPLKTPAAPDCKDGAQAIVDFIKRELPLLRAKLKEEDAPESPCILSPDSRYRGAENQLYRVEIHHVSDDGKLVTFKWSRENGSVVFPVINIESDSAAKKSVVTLAHFGRDAHLGLAKGDWVELVDDTSVNREQPRPLWKVDDLDRDEGAATFSGVEPTDLAPGKHALLRRWDHKESAGVKVEKDGALRVVLAAKPDTDWLVLEDGVQIQFQLPNAGKFRTGDYWLIPARTTGAIEWPGSPSDPDFVPPRGIVHHYAPLGIVAASGGDVKLSHDCRCKFARVDISNGTPIEILGVSPDWPE